MGQKKNAFTLIELLVVIAIIGLLLAIIAPSLQLAKERAQFIFCKVNLKSYGLAMKLYTSDNDDVYPDECWNAMFAGDRGGTNGLPRVQDDGNCEWHNKEISPQNNPGFAGPLWQYMDSQDAHMCPTFKKFAKTYGADHPNHNPAIPIEPQYAYSLNVFLGSLKSDGQPYCVRKETEVISPGETLSWVEETIWLIQDEQGPSGRNWSDYVLNDTCFASRHWDDFSFGDFVATYHNTSLARKNDGEGNAVFVDGHVQLLDPYYTIPITGGYARAGFIYSWPLKGKRSPDMKY